MPIPLPRAIELTDDERVQLEAWTRRRTSAQALAMRSRIVLLAAEGLNNSEIAVRLDLAVSSVRKWRKRFAEHRLEGLTDEPRPGRPRTITDEQVEEVIVRTLETTPRDATTGRPGRWRARSASRSRRFCGSGGRSGCSRTASRRTAARDPIGRADLDGLQAA